MTRRRRRMDDLDDQDTDVETKEGEATEIDSTDVSDGDPEKLFRRVIHIERKNEDLINKMGIALMDIRTAEEKVKRVTEAFKDIESLADEVNKTYRRAADNYQ